MEIIIQENAEAASRRAAKLVARLVAEKPNAVEGPVAAIAPASMLQHHPNAKCFVDDDAASSLTMADYYRWVYDGKPDWQQDA